MKSSNRRIADYLIYVGCGLILSLILFGPIVWGIDMDWYLPRVMAIGSATATVALLAYELKSWRRSPVLWLFLSTVGMINLAIAFAIEKRHAVFNVGAWIVAAATLQLYLFEWIFRRLARYLRLES